MHREAIKGTWFEVPQAIMLTYLDDNHDSFSPIIKVFKKLAKLLCIRDS